MATVLCLYSLYYEAVISYSMCICMLKACSVATQLARQTSLHKEEKNSGSKGRNVTLERKCECGEKVHGGHFVVYAQGIVYSATQ